MSNSADPLLVVEIAQLWLTQVAPSELPIFRAASKKYIVNPEQVLAGIKAADEVLGFGGGEAVTMLTPVVLTIGTQVVQFLTAELQKSLKEQSATLIQAKVRAVFKSIQTGEKTSGAQTVTLTPTQLAQVREMVLKNAAVLKLSDARARLLADAVVGSLAT